MVMDVPGLDNNPGTGIWLWPQNGGQNQEWFVQAAPNDEGYFFIHTSINALVLDIPGGSTDNDVQIMQWKLQQNDSQKWVMYDSGQSATLNTGQKYEFYWIFNKHSNKLLTPRLSDVVGPGGIDNGTPIVQNSPSVLPDQGAALSVTPWS